MNSVETERQPTYDIQPRTLHGLGGIVALTLFEHPELTIQQIEKEASQDIEHYLAWTWVRLKRAPDAIGTLPNLSYIGMEGYAAGVWSSEQYLKHTMSTGKQFLDTMTREHRYNARFRRWLYQTLSGEYLSLTVLHAMNDLFSAKLAKLRMLALNTCDRDILYQNTAFRQKTYSEIHWFPRFFNV